MKPYIAPLFFLSLVFTSACAQPASPECSPDETDADCAEPVDPPETDTEPPPVECSEPVDVSQCVVTYPACDLDRPHPHFMTHGAGVCDSDPPSTCEFMADIQCNGVTTGVWCCP